MTVRTRSGKHPRSVGPPPQVIDATGQPAGTTLGSSDPLNADVAVRANFTTWASSGQFTMERSVYEGSDGHYYTEREMWRPTGKRRVDGPLLG
jgi:hypothetical protein